MTDSKYFTTTKKGEIFELKSELNNDKKEKKKEAVKKVSSRTRNRFQRLISLIVLGDCEHDCGQGCFCLVPRRRQLYANRQLGIEETRLSLFDELRQVSTGYGHHGSQHFCQGRFLIFGRFLDTSFGTYPHNLS